MKALARPLFSSSLSRVSDVNEEDIAALQERVYAMSEADRHRLDPVAYALEEWLRVDRRKAVFIVPNRIAALAAIDAMLAWEKTSFECD
jgi:hypothetical protein